jgi:hypothetical protein
MSKIYTDSLPIEMLAKDVYAAVNNISKFINYAKLELTSLETEDKIDDANLIVRNFNQVLLDHYKELSEMNTSAIAHNTWMAKTLESFEEYLNDMNGFVIGQEHVNEERYEYYMGVNTHDFKRDENLYKIIEKQCAKWKVEFKESSK